VLLNLSATTAVAPFNPLFGIYLYCGDPDNDMEYCEVSIDGQTVVTIPDMKGYPYEGIDYYTVPDGIASFVFRDAGDHVITVFARDREGQNASKSVSFTVTKQASQMQNGSSNKLIWPVDCEFGVDCSISNYPDLDKNRIAACGNTYEGHEGTDFAFTWSQMDKGVDVYAAADGVVQWAFDGKYDRCTSFGPDAVITNPDCAAPSGSTSPSGSSGYQVCTEVGSYCNAQLQAERGWTQCYWCFWGGNVVVIRHPNNPYVFATRYDHFKTGSITVRPGDAVKAGQKIGQVGSAGRSSGPHLHFEVWSDWYLPVDPWDSTCSSSGHGLWQ
jgi:murein DD-endopeptidase MepM/ murein hydrolase activator NlpD